MKKIILILFVLVAGLIFGISAYNGAPDYVKSKDVFKGYYDKAGRSCAGKDLDEYNVYHYSEEDIEKFANSERYSVLSGSKTDELIELVKMYEDANDDVHFSGNISDGDYYILEYYDSDGNEIEKSDEHFYICIFDIETQVLHRAYVVW